ncbi:striatin-interacting protein 2 isoform X2 [Tympanuchus pallidicinctus]|uniref:striatin-interacting protein 2 isoform X2 n=1 Tax=Tympanuchus pallidicinctus TaxID=109042 RepID=UPI0022876411|nr:striatin-interacting protein 2 isoform X2 [Tympanuchus pallidicinctus]
MEAMDFRREGLRSARGAVGRVKAAGLRRDERGCVNGAACRMQAVDLMPGGFGLGRNGEHVWGCWQGASHGFERARGCLQPGLAAIFTHHFQTRRALWISPPWSSSTGTPTAMAQSWQSCTATPRSPSSAPTGDASRRSFAPKRGAGSGRSWTQRSRGPKSCGCWRGWRWSAGSGGCGRRGPSSTWHRQQPGVQQCAAEASHLTGRQHRAQVPVVALGSAGDDGWGPRVTSPPRCPIRVLLSVMYLLVENIRVELETDPPEWKSCRETFRTELSFPMRSDEPFALLLFTMVTKFCSGHAPHFPMKKVLLLLWKVLLFTLGGFEALQMMKVRRREELGLPPLPEDSIQVMRSMRAASPPTCSIELAEQQQKRGHRSRRPLMKQDSLDIYNERDPFKNDETGVDEEEGDEVDGGIEGELDLMERDALLPAIPVQRPPIERVSFPKGLPWAPKVRDTETLIGLPRPIHESVRTLKQHKYVSISDVQIKNEEELEKCPMSLGEEEVQETPCEVLYRAMLYNLPQYMIALLKILLAAAPTSKAKTDSINILADVLPEEMPITVLQSMKLGIDVNRHKEIIVKSISALLLLLLKHFKLNHIYQFEYVSQHLVFANCIPLILKFFNQNIMSYITAKNSISVLDYPHCTVHKLPELTAESLEAGDNNQFCWRNLFSCINLLRILNKLTKWKHSRTMMLVVFKSAPILKRALKVKQAMMQLYVLKLLKIQTKYLGRQWRKSNMKTMSAIYQKVRHRMNDDWAYGNDIDARPWDFQAEECTLRASIEAFNSRRYDKPQDSEFAPVDNCLQSVLGQRLELPEDFHYSYELWLEREVFSQPIRWEELLRYQ